jgi:thiol:disulfide interchange protein DsbC
MTKLLDAARTRLVRRSTWLVTIVGGLAAVGSAFAFSLFTGTGALEANIQKSFPNTKITSVTCGTHISGLCEVIAGRNVFYASRNGRFVVVGSVIDLSKKLDLTDERLRQVAAAEAVVGKVGDRKSPTPAAPAEGMQNIRVTLPRANAIVHNAGAPTKVSVFSDFSCGYCRAFFAEIAANKDIEVAEYPVAILGPESATKARLVLCANDRIQASGAAYGEGEIRTQKDCSEAQRAVDANTDFARQNGITGTPTIVRADGRVNQGYLDTAALRTFAEAKS